jgi:hypothetical protein
MLSQANRRAVAFGCSPSFGDEPLIGSPHADEGSPKSRLYTRPVVWCFIALIVYLLSVAEHHAGDRQSFLRPCGLARALPSTARLRQARPCSAGDTNIHGYVPAKALRS